MAETGFKYRAFISYAHVDRRWAVWLHRALENYRVPRRLAGAEELTRIGKCFRDEEELAAAAELGPKITNALQSSDVLIVVCSPRSAKSRWVNQEIEAFKQIGRESRVFALIVDGEPHGAADTECFPPALKVTTAGGVAEPLAVDVRKFGRDDAILRLVGGILDVGYDDLRQREARRRRTQLLRAQALFVSGLVLFVAAVAGGFLAVANSVDTIEQKSALLAASADQLSAEDNYLAGVLMALHADPAAEAGWAEQMLRANGFVSRDALVRAYTHNRLEAFFGDDGVTALAASSSKGGNVVLGHADGSVNIWSAAGERLKRLTGTGSYEVSAVALSADQKVVAAGDRGGELRIWDAATSKMIASFPASELVVHAVALSPDGQQVATVSYTDEMKVWSTQGGPPLFVLKGRGTNMKAVAYSPDGSQILVASAANAIEAWSAATGEKIEAALSFDEKIHAFAISPDGKSIIAAGDFGNGYQRGLDVPDDTVSFKPHAADLAFVDVSPLNGSVLTSDGDGTAKVFKDIAQQTPTVFFGDIKSAHFIDGGLKILTRKGDGRVQVWTVFRGKVLRDLVTPAVERVAISPDGSAFAVLAYDNVSVWSSKTGEVMLRQNVAGEWSDLRFSKDGDEVLVVSNKGQVFRWRLSDGLESVTADLGVSDWYDVDATGTMILTARPKLLPVGGRDAPLKTSWGGHDGAVGGIFAAKEPLVLIGYRDETNILWSTATGEQRSEFKGRLFDEDGVLASVIALSPDGSTVAEGLPNGVIRTFSTANGARLGTLIGHRKEIVGLAFSPDGKLLVSASGDGTVKVWSPRSGLALETFEPADTDLVDVVFAPDGQSVMAGSKNRTMFWQIDPIVTVPARKQVDMACEKLLALDFTEFESADFDRFPIIGSIGRNACLAASRWPAAGFTPAN